MNEALLAGIIGGWELVLILAVILVLFGAKKLPELAKGLGQGIKEFKKASRDVTEELHAAMDDTPPPRRYNPPSPQIEAPTPTSNEVVNDPQNTATPKV